MRILAVDLGTQRTGVAISDEREMLASPVGTIEEWDFDRLVMRVIGVAASLHAAMIVVGHPRNMDGTCGESAKRAERFVAALREKTTRPIELWDERMTTMSAIGYLNETDVRGKKRKQVIDTVAATIILEDFLRSRKNGQP